MDYWTTVVWQVVIALAPIIVGICMKLVQDFILTRSEAIQLKIRTAIEDAIKAAQKIEPDVTKRKDWVVVQVLRIFPSLDPIFLSTLIESILATLQLDEGTLWSELPPTPAE